MAQDSSSSSGGSSKKGGGSGSGGPSGGGGSGSGSPSGGSGVKEYLPPLVPIPVAPVRPNEPNTLRVPPTVHTASMLEIEDATFNHDSAVMLPEEPDPDPKDEGGVQPQQARVSGLHVLRETYIFAKRNPDKELLITAHTDTTGSHPYNLKLSNKRADNIVFLLLGKRDDWVTSCKDQHKVRDYQQILNWVFWNWGWPCFVVVSGVKDPATKHSAEVFQEKYNSVFGKNIDVDGDVGTQTWGAFYDMYMERLAQLLQLTDVSKIQDYRDEITWFDEGKQAVGCGENWPIDNPNAADSVGPVRQFGGVDEYRSQANRRVELLFFDPGEGPPLECHPSKKKCIPRECRLHDRSRYRRTPVPIHVGQVTLRLGHLVMEDDPGKPKKGWSPAFQRKAAANYSYTLTGASGDRTGDLDGSGTMSFWIANNERELDLKLENPETGTKYAMKLRFGELKPLESDEGRRQRLRNLGYGPATRAGWADPNPPASSTDRPEVHESGSIALFKKDKGLRSNEDEFIVRGSLGREHGDRVDVDDV